jgi:hypothetical protein
MSSQSTFLKSNFHIKLFKKSSTFSAFTLKRRGQALSVPAAKILLMTENEQEDKE